MTKEVRVTPASGASGSAPRKALKRSTTVAQIEQGLKGLSHSLNSNFEVEEYILQRRRAGKLTTGDLIYRALANPASSPVGMILAIFLLLSALASVIIGAYYQSIEAHERTLLIPCTKEDGARHCAMSPSQAWDITFLCIFGLELVVRIAVSVKPWTQVSIWIETLCCLPLVMRLVLASQGLRPLELEHGWRVVAILVQALAPLRLLKIARYSSAAVILKKAIADSSSALWIPFYLLMVLFTLVGGVVYAFEYSPDAYDPTSGQVHTLLECWWMMLVTMVTVGYGDYSPATVPGRIFTAIAMCMGLCFTAMPLAIVGNTFSTAWEARALATIREQLKKHLLASNLGATNLEEAFANFDLDGNGSIDYAEFKHVVVDVLGVPLDVKKLRKVWRSLDQDDSNIIKYQEFCLAIFPEYEVSMDNDAPVTGSFKRSRSPADEGDAPVTGPASRYSPPATAPATAGSPSAPPRVGSAGSKGRQSSTGRGAAPGLEERLAKVESAIAQQQSLEAAVQRCQEQQEALQATMQQLLSALKER